jgi:hypothetical protein
MPEDLKIMLANNEYKYENTNDLCKLDANSQSKIHKTTDKKASCIELCR